jgi:hypothetical protein
MNDDIKQQEIVTAVARPVEGRWQAAVFQRRGNVNLSRLLQIVANGQSADGLFDSGVEARAAAAAWIKALPDEVRFARF